MDKNYGRAYTRRKNWRHALRKRMIDRAKSAGRWPDYYDNLHQYSDNKIHCSCWMCRNGINAGHNSEHQLKISDKRKLDAMKAQIREEDNNE